MQTLTSLNRAEFDGTGRKLDELDIPCVLVGFVERYRPAGSDPFHVCCRDLPRSHTDETTLEGRPLIGHLGQCRTFPGRSTHRLPSQQLHLRQRKLWPTYYYTGYRIWSLRPRLFIASVGPIQPSWHPIM